MIKTRFIRASVVMALVFCLAGLAGCGSDQPAKVQLHGQLAIVGQGPLPKGATARISLIQHETDNTDDRIVAEQTLHNLGEPPVNFDLDVGRQLLGTDGHYAMSAQVLDQAGNVRWQTRVPQTVNPLGQSSPVTLMLQAHTLQVAGDYQHYRCADDFDFDMAKHDQQAVIHMGNRQISLEARPLGNGQGAIYADEHGDQLTFGHDKITLAMDGATHMDCVAAKAPDQAEQAAKK